MKKKPKTIEQALFQLWEPIAEIYHGVRARTIPAWCSVVAFLAGAVLLLKIDLFLFSKAGLRELYPFFPPLYKAYYFAAVTFGFWLWAWREVFRKRLLTKTLADVFSNAGLVSRIGRSPGFISDYPVDGVTRKARLTNAGFPKSKFEEVKQSLEAGLRIYIDDFKEIREKGIIEIRYSHIPMPSIVKYEEVDTKPYQFLVGSTRARKKYSNFRDTPHLMIAGQTGGGKSTFLRQFITHLWAKNKGIQFLLVDLKGGLEFSLFENRKRITVSPSVKEAIKELKKIDSMLEKRMAFLKAEKCKDIDAYFSKKRTTNES